MTDGKTSLGSLLWVALSVTLLSGCGPTSSAGDTANNNQNACLPGQTRCSTGCVNLLSDVNHCGACERPCNPGEVCDGTGNCSVSCQDGLFLCGSSCVNTSTDPSHCGGCDRPCNQGLICRDGDCIDDSCTETTSQAQSGALPADIIVVVDNSGSMTDEAVFVQEAMNDFVAVIMSSQIDYRVILISADNTDTQGICVPGPLGSGSCPADENLPNFVHVYQEVASSNSLELILSTYSQWSSHLRPGATRTIAVITDDNSALAAQDFRDQMIALDPTFQGFKFDAIYAPYELTGMECFPCMNTGNCITCDACCGLDSSMGVMCTPLPAEEGTVYRELVQMTGGVEGNLCTQDFMPVFIDMATAVVADSQVACVYNIPEPSGGEEIDYGRVNVEFLSAPNAQPVLIFHVPGGIADCGPNGGWYYDDPSAPTQVIFCPATCTMVESAPQGSVTVKFGCATVVG